MTSQRQRSFSFMKPLFQLVLFDKPGRLFYKHGTLKGGRAGKFKRISCATRSLRLVPVFNALVERYINV